MFEARFIDGASFKKIVEALKDFKEINLECDYDGIKLKVMDECHVSLADLQLNASIFEHYRCDKKCALGLNMETLQKLTRLAPNDLPLVLRKSNDADRLRIESDEDLESGMKRAADIGLINVVGETLHVPEQSYHVQIEIPTKVYAHLMKDLSGIGEDLSISVTNNTIKFETDGERGRVENVFHKGQGVFSATDWEFNPSQQSNTTVTQAFAIRFLSAFSKACPLSETMTLSMTSGVPLRLQFPLGNESYLSYYVAPALE